MAEIDDDDLPAVASAMSAELERLTDDARKGGAARQRYDEIGAALRKITEYARRRGIPLYGRRQRVPIMPGQNPRDPDDVPHVKTVREVRQILGKIKKADRCSDDCPGWAIFNESFGRPEIQVCDECMTALPKHLRLSDDDVAQLAEAQRELKEAEARVLEDDEDQIEGNPERREWQRPKGTPPGVPILPGQNPRGAFTAKGERMYRDIKRGYRGDPRASEIAARTVYARAKEGVPGLVKKRR